MKAFGRKGIKSELEILMSADDSNSVNFASTVRAMGKINPKIKLMMELLKGFKQVHEKYAIYVDCVESIGMTQQQRKGIKIGQLRSSMLI